MSRQFYFYVYKDPRILTGGNAFYIGKGTGKRAFQHLNARPTGSNLHLLRKISAIRRDGLTPIVERFLVESESLALEAEMLLIELVGRRCTKEGPLVNLSIGGDGSAGCVWSEESRAKQSLLTKGRVRPPDASAKAAASNLGRKRSPEQVEKMRAAQQKRRACEPPNKREAEAERLRALSQSPEGRAALRAKATGVKISEETREKMRRAARERMQDPSIRQRISEKLKGRPPGRILKRKEMDDE